MLHAAFHLADSPLYTLPNVVLTPHIASSLGPKCLRLGIAMVDEFERFLDGRALHWELNSAQLGVLA
jgi:phosphoglycerate dehydrogenase-like enzyme